MSNNNSSSSSSSSLPPEVDLLRRQVIEAVAAPLANVLDGQEAGAAGVVLVAVGRALTQAGQEYLNLVLRSGPGEAFEASECQDSGQGSKTPPGGYSSSGSSSGSSSSSSSSSQDPQAAASRIILP